MESKEAIISLEIGMYNYTEEFYFIFKEKNKEYDPVFLQSLLLTNYIFKVYLETGDSEHSQAFENFLRNIKLQDLDMIINEKKDFLNFNHEESSTDDIRFFLDLLYSDENYNFSFEAQGNWSEKELYKLDMVNSVIELISFLGKKNKQINNFNNFLIEILNSSGEYFKDNIFLNEDIEEASLMITILAYENYLNDITFM